MYNEYLLKLEETGEIRNLKERSINCYKNYVSYFLDYVKNHPEELTCQDVRESRGLFIMQKNSYSKKKSFGIQDKLCYYKGKEQRLKVHRYRLKGRSLCSIKPNRKWCKRRCSSLESQDCVFVYPIIDSNLKNLPIYRITYFLLTINIEFSMCNFVKY